MTSKLIDNYLPEIFALKLSRSRPSMVTVNLTNRCDQKCIYCEIGSNIPSNNNEKLTIKDLEWIIDEMATSKIPKISLCGGEPFLFEGIIDIVAYAGNKNIRCSITTNGMIVSKLDDEELNVLKTYKAEINISIDSFQDSIESYTRGIPAALPNALKSIKKLREEHIPVTILTVITKYNYHDIFNFYNFSDGNSFPFPYF